MQLSPGQVCGMLAGYRSIWLHLCLVNVVINVDSFCASLLYSVNLLKALMKSLTVYLTSNQVNFCGTPSNPMFSVLAAARLPPPLLDIVVFRVSFGSRLPGSVVVTVAYGSWCTGQI